MCCSSQALDQATAPDVLELEARLLTAEQEAQRWAADAREQTQHVQVGAESRALCLSGRVLGLQRMGNSAD